MIPFNVPPVVGTEQEYIAQAIESHTICGDGPFTERCHRWLRKHNQVPCALLTTSCTHALELSAILCNLKPGDEVIMPSYTFVSTANAFVLRGAQAVFVDIRPDTMNIDETLIEAAITPKTRAIVPVHYASVACEMDSINRIASQNNLFVIEDAAQGIMARYKGKPLGSLGHFGCYSFHETKNISCGEGGALLISDECYGDAAEIIREKGTDRSRFHRGQVDKYTWQSMGSSYLPSELNAAYLWAQFEMAPIITAERLRLWNRYYDSLQRLAQREFIQLPIIPRHCHHNGHLFYIKTKCLQERSKLIEFLRDREVLSVFHYIPLHSSPAGKILGRMHGEDRYTTRESEKILRLPLFWGLTDSDVDKTVTAIQQFYSTSN